MKKILYVVATILSGVLMLGSWQGWLPFSLTEMLGFVSGGWTVWLTVKENIWNWPIGILNAAFFLVLFLQSRLFADSALQIVYIVLGFLGWYWWLYGGKEKTELPIARMTVTTGIVLAVIMIVCTWPLTLYLRHINDISPFWDALTTVMSLVAQYLLTKKIIENWGVWIAADVIYVALYAYKGLYLTGILYFIFLCMCIRGIVEWRRTMQSAGKLTTERNVQI